MNHVDVVNGLLALGFDSGWAVTEGQIVLWERDEPQPSEAELIAAIQQNPEQENN